MADIDMAARTSAWFWKHRGINTLADLDDVEAVTARINPGRSGMDDRRQKTILARQAFYPRA